MKPSERKALLLLISGIEGQILAIKSYLGASSNENYSKAGITTSTKGDPSVLYTDQDEDDKIAEALERDKLTSEQEFLRSLIAEEGPAIAVEQ